MRFQFSYTAENIRLTLLPEKPSGLLRFLKKPAPASLRRYSDEDQRLLFALADLRALGEELRAPPQIDDAQIIMSHGLAAHLDSQTAKALDLPPLTEFTLKTDTEGELGKPSFKLHYDWFYKQQPQPMRRTGAILETELGLRRLPYFIMDALDIADSPYKNDSLEADWEALARFRLALDPQKNIPASAENEKDAVDNHEFAAAADKIAMGKFFKNLKINLADSFSVARARNGDKTDFEVVPFSRQKLAQNLNEDARAEEKNAELGDYELENFQSRLRARGALPAYQIERGHYLVIDRSAAPVLRLMAEKQRAPIKERQEFIENPYPALRRAAEERLRELGALEGLSSEEQEEAIEAQYAGALIETREYSERVIGIKIYKKSQMPIQSGGTAWLPEQIPDELRQEIEEKLSGKAPEEVESIVEQTEQAISQGEKTVCIDGKNYPAQEVKIIAQGIQTSAESGAGGKRPNADAHDEGKTDGPVILDTLDNSEQIEYAADRQKREALTELALPGGIVTKLRNYQMEGLRRQQESWIAGMPGILNADEQGLGKTLQTIAFLRWLKDNAIKRREDARAAQAAEMQSDNQAASAAKGQKGGAQAGPILIVAPTSLLTNWQEEVRRHTLEGLGTLIPLYGSDLRKYKSGRRGKETDSGEELLDFGEIKELIREGFGDRYWFLTTYNSLTDYQHSLAKIHFSAIVFDEIQALKNPYSLRACAARGMNADYHIGLTGTPIENASIDLWAIMDILAPGALGTKKEFQEKYGTPNQENMQELYNAVFTAKEASADAPLAFRRLKRDAAKDLPKKRRFLYPRLMPDIQENVYDEARIRLKGKGGSAALKILQHIRSVSVHPNLGMEGSEADFIKASARLTAYFDILRAIKAKNERALIFVESLKMQERLIALAQREFGLDNIQRINGSTPQRQRQKIVENFQHHLAHGDGGGFDMLVLGPRAAGTGLTLTAATHVIHLSRWWNPAVEEQCNDRIHRIGQKHDVSIHVPMAIHRSYLDNSFDCLLQNLMQRKRRLAETALWPMGDTEGDSAELFGNLEKEHLRQPAAGEDKLAFTMRSMLETEQAAGKELTPHCWQIE